jgi:hypothetical protein
MTEPQPKITREDLEQKFKSLQDDIQGVTDRNKTSIATYAAIAGGVVVIIAYALGRRSGRKRRSVLEIRQ